MFQGLNDLIYWSEDFAEWLTPTLSFIRGFVPSTPLMIQILI